MATVTTIDESTSTTEQPRGKVTEPPNFAESIAALEAEAKAKASGEKGPILSTEEERTSPVVTIGGKDYYIPSMFEWSMGQLEVFAELLPEFMPLAEEAMDLFSRNAMIRLYHESRNKAESDYAQRVTDEAITATADGREPAAIPPPEFPDAPAAISGDEIKSLVQRAIEVITAKRLHRRVLAASYIPVGSKFAKDAMDDIAAAMEEATVIHLMQAVGRFFTTGNG